MLPKIARYCLKLPEIAASSVHSSGIHSLGTLPRATGVSRAPKSPKKSEESLPGPEAPGVPKSLEKVWKKVLFPDVFETFSRLGDFGPRGPDSLRLL